MVFFLPQVAFSQEQRADVLHYKVEMNATGIFNSGLQARATLTLIKNETENLTLDLQGFNIDSVRIEDTTRNFTKTDSTILIEVPAVYLPEDTITAEIFYHGIPYTDPSWGGFYRQGTYAYNLGVGFTSKPHNLGRAWFPCNDNFTDRATYEVSVTTGSGSTAVCGGILINDSTNGDGTRTWTWRLNQPVPSYLASVAIGPYAFVKYEFNALNGNIPVWLAAEPKDTINLRQSFIRLNNALQCFEERFGPYRFDRVGYVGVPFGSGAMEHATNIAYPLYAINGTADYETLMAHELAHHWWGDLATCRTAEDMWLNEGWASYCESLFLECLYGHNAAVTDLREKLNEVLLKAPGDDAGFRAVSGVPHEYTYGTHVYKKGALMVHALRTVMGDNAFFTACKSYLNGFAFRDVSSIDLRDEFQKHTTADLTLFFDQYIFEKGHYDVVVANKSINGSDLVANLYELSRFKTAKNPALSVDASLHFTDGSVIKHNVQLTQGEGRLDVSMPAGKTLRTIQIDPEVKYALAHTYQEEKIVAPGVKAFSDAMLTINAQAVPDTVTLHVEHHWVGPIEGNLRLSGIRISTERYWSIRGDFPQGFTAWAFFNYDGSATGYLDAALFEHTATEDSLVLLYRRNENDGWQPVSVQDLTFQPGGTPTDMLGRFWLLKLQPGDYTFGIRDAGVTAVQELQGRPVLRLSPNPAHNELTVTLPSVYSEVVVLLYDMNGRVLREETMNPKHDGSFRFDTTSLLPGTYQLVVRCGNETLTGRFIKR